MRHWSLCRAMEGNTYLQCGFILLLHVLNLLLVLLCSIRRRRRQANISITRVPVGFHPPLHGQSSTLCLSLSPNPQNACRSPTAPARAAGSKAACSARASRRVMLPLGRELAVVLCAEGFFVGCACCREKFPAREGGRYWGMLRFLTRGESSGSRSGCIRPPRQTASSATPSESRQNNAAAVTPGQHMAVRKKCSLGFPSPLPRCSASLCAASPRGRVHPPALLG